MESTSSCNSGSQFCNYQGDFSIVLLAVVDAQYRFWVIGVGGPAFTSDYSPLFLWPMRRSPMRNLMRTFSCRVLPTDERIFDYRLSRAWLVIEDVFGILTSQWRMYRRLIQLRPDLLEQCVKTTCLLHNFIRASCADEAPVLGPFHQHQLVEMDPEDEVNLDDDATGVWNTYKAFFSAEGAVPAE
ncbi:hypothetical protein WMY93_014099 [Mugilogobius chulae]|uniref:DDE Tnp4 domain-containing protein n=1 Tax=Mugilogobius chulae TaxID=88201 RepID=A0AAW0P054_9GOBI